MKKLILTASVLVVVSCFVSAAFAASAGGAILLPPIDNTLISTPDDGGSPDAMMHTGITSPPQSGDRIYNPADGSFAASSDCGKKKPHHIIL